MVQRSRGRIVGAVVAILVGVAYLINPTGGLVELIPDIVPFAGNLDEAAATALLLYGLRELRGGTSIHTDHNERRGP